jgi:hypothetical protein
MVRSGSLRRQTRELCVATPRQAGSLGNTADGWPSLSRTLRRLGQSAVTETKIPALPESLYVVLIENGISAQNRRIQRLRLSYQQAVKGVAMMQG